MNDKNKDGRAMVFFKRMFSSNQTTNQATPTNKSGIQPSKPNSALTKAPQSKSSNQKATAKAKPLPTTTVIKDQSSTPPTNNVQAKLLVRPARAKSPNQASQTQEARIQNPASNQPTKLAPPNKAPPSQSSGSKWSSNSMGALEPPETQLSLSSYAHPRPPHSSAGRRQVDKSEVLTRFGMIGSNEVSQNGVDSYRVYYNSLTSDIF